MAIDYGRQTDEPRSWYSPTLESSTDLVRSNGFGDDVVAALRLFLGADGVVAALLLLFLCAHSNDFDGLSCFGVGIVTGGGPS